MEILTFAAAGEQYALEILEVREIVELRSLTRVPSAPKAVRGVVSLRGRAVPVLDLGLHLGMPSAPLTQRSCVIMVDGPAGGKSGVVGILADAVSKVVDVPDTDLEEPPSITATGVALVKALAKADDRFVMVLDLPNVLERLGRGLDELTSRGEGLDSPEVSTARGVDSAPEARIEAVPEY